MREDGEVRGFKRRRESGFLEVRIQGEEWFGCLI